MAKTTTQVERKFNARPDSLDFRDKMFQPTLIEVPTRRDLSDYMKLKVPILDQGQEGACTGFGLATVVHYLLITRRISPDKIPVSARMLYEMAKRYDEWPGENYEGSSARGAMKGWHKHGVCEEKLWKYDPAQPDVRLTSERVSNAARRPLGAYYRVNHRDLVSMHTAIAEVGILYATATVHQGWQEVGADGEIRYEPNIKTLGGHAFAIVAYDEQGFWIQNSWGADWGKKGFARVSYDDWLMNATDVWVARLGAPVVIRTATASAVSMAAGSGKSNAYGFCDLRPHIISIGNEGALRTDGTYGTDENDVQEIFEQAAKTMKGWKNKRLLIYAHGGLTGEESAIQRVADYRPALLRSEVYPIAFIWKTDYWTTLANIIGDALKRRRPEGFLDGTKDFMLDRLDDALEPIARKMTGKSQWDEMKENALLATLSPDGGARIAAGHIAAMKQDRELRNMRVHVVGHSAGSILHAPFIQLLSTAGAISAATTVDGQTLNGEEGHGVKIDSCTLWAPACTMDLFMEAYAPAILSGMIGQFNLFTLTDKAEQNDDCGNIYHKSLLYLVSNAFEKEPRIPLFRDGWPILGMERWIEEKKRTDRRFKKLFDSAAVSWIRSPNTEVAEPDRSTARTHGSFDDDEATVKATLARILGKASTGGGKIEFHRSTASLRSRRRQMS